MNLLHLALRLLFLAPLAPQSASEVVRDVGIDQKLGSQVALELPFVDERGRDVRLGELFDRRPVVLALVYHRCPMLCSQVLDGVLRALRGITLAAGTDFDVVVVSIDPTDTSALAAKKMEATVAQYGREGGARGWHFLVGGEASIRRLADDVGFRYLYDPATKQFAHASGFFVLTPKGVVSRYFYGLEHSASDLRLALVESSEGRVGNLVDQVLLLCFHYDPATGRYGFAILNAIRLLGILTVAGLGALVWSLTRRERGP